MNTVKSVYYGWATLIVAGGGAYFFAKRSINADRAAKAEADRQKRINLWKLEQQHLNSSSQSSSSFTTSQLLAQNSTSPQSTQSPQGRMGTGGAGSGLGGGPGYGAGGGLTGAEDGASGNPSVQASQDPAPTRHEPLDEAGKAREKSKYEASDVYRSRKGDRFS